MAAVNNNDSTIVAAVRPSRNTCLKLVNLLGQDGLKPSLDRCVLERRYWTSGSGTGRHQSIIGRSEQLSLHKRVQDSSVMPVFIVELY